jgi:micrococcal nuclease
LNYLEVFYVDDLFLLLCLLSILAIVVGLFAPKVVVRWGANRSRGRVLMYYGISAIVFFILFGATTDAKPTSTQQADKPKVNTTKTETIKNEATPKQESIITGRWAIVAKVVDGDTVELEGGEKVRLIGVNTPETVKPDSLEQPYGKEASGFTKSQIEGKKVFVETDVQEKDNYGRTLAYIYLQKPKTEEEIEKYMFNATLLREGYAQLMTIPPNSKHTDLFVKEQKAAREAGKGIWALGIYKDSATSTDDVFLEGKDPAKQVAQAPAPEPKKEEPKQQAVAPAPAPEPRKASGKASPSGGVCPPEFPVKGNHSSSGELIYHVPGGAFYNKTNPEECFETPADAQAAGYRASKR